MADKKTNKKTDKRTDNKKIIAVVGATGAQGGGLVNAILKDKKGAFAVRVITRDPNSAKHVIWSTLEDTRKSIPLSDDRMPTLMGKYKVPHFDAKGEADGIFTELGVPTTFLVTSFYWDNFIHFGMGPKKGADGKLAITLPLGTKKLAGIAAEDIGKTAYAIFEKGAEMIGKTVGIAGGHLTGAQMAKSLTKALGQEVKYNPVPPATYRSFGFTGADDLGNMFQFNSEFEQDCCDARSISETKSLNPELQTFDRWLAQNKSRIPLG